MSGNIDDLVRVIALDRAYQISGSTGPGQACLRCGLPAVRWACSGPKYPFTCCRTCTPPDNWASSKSLEWVDHSMRVAIERLLRIAGEF